MEQDYMSIIFGISTFVLFIITHIVLFRYIEAKQVLRFLMIVYLVCLFLLAVLCMTVDLHPAVIFIFSFIVYSSLVFIYVIGVFGLVESSIRIRLLGMIAREGERGMGKKEIEREYNGHLIVRKRLARLCSSGELVCEKGYFRKKKSLSFVYIPYYLTRFMFFLYRSEIV